MTTEEKMIQAMAFGLALCAIATRQGVGRFQEGGVVELQLGVVSEARAISRAVIDEFKRLQAG